MEPQCRSCGMPIENPADFGTSRDGSKSGDYCRFCFKDGNFAEPDMTMEQMIERVAGFAKKMNVTEQQARSMAKSLIPKLRRWKTKCL